MVALLEPFIDTIVICTMTAIVIIITGTYANVGGLGGSELTSQAFGSVIWWFPYILTIAIFYLLFQRSFLSYYGLKSWTFLFGQSKNTELTYKVLLMFFVVVGSSVNLGSVLDFSDMMILAMAFPNIIGLLFLSSEVKEDLKTYFEKKKMVQLKSLSNNGFKLYRKSKDYLETIKEFSKREIIPYMNEWDEKQIFPLELFKKIGS